MNTTTAYHHSLILLILSLLLFGCQEQAFLFPDGRPINAQSALEDIQAKKFRILMAGLSPPNDTIQILVNKDTCKLARVSVAGCLVERELFPKIDEYNGVVERYLKSNNVMYSWY